jgi:hypothetical protein
VAAKENPTADVGSNMVKPAMQGLSLFWLLFLAGSGVGDEGVYRSSAIIT